MAIGVKRFCIHLQHLAVIDLPQPTRHQVSRASLRIPSCASFNLNPRRDSPRSIAVRDKLFLLRTRDSEINSLSSTAVASFSFNLEPSAARTGMAVPFVGAGSLTLAGAG